MGSSATDGRRLAALTADFAKAVETCIAKYIDFSGRATRSEYWYFFLFAGVLPMIVLALLVASGAAETPGSSFWEFVAIALALMFLLGVHSPSLPTIVAVFLSPNNFVALMLTVLVVLFALFTLAPGVAVAVRRLHDRDHPWWWWWFFGGIILLWQYCSDGTGGDNQFGPDPLGNSEHDLRRRA